MNYQRHFLTWLVILGLFVRCAEGVAQEPNVATHNPQPTPSVKLSLLVRDRADHSVANLTKEAIEIFEDNVPQTVISLSKDQRPVDYALVIDNTGSVRPLFPQILNAAKSLIDHNNLADQTFIERFISSNKIETVQEFTSDKARLMDGLDSLYIEIGQSAVIDGIYLALRHVAEHKPGPDRRRALVVITDGDDRNSYYSENQLMRLIRATDVQPFVIGIVDLLDNRAPLVGLSQEDKAKKLLTNLAREGGGRTYFPRNVLEVQHAVAEIVHDLHEQYMFGYESTGGASPENFRNIAVRISKTDGNERLTAIARSGYFVNPPDLDSLDGEKKKNKKKPK